MLRLQRYKKGEADAKRGGRAKAEQHRARQARNGRPANTQPHLLRRTGRPALFLAGSVSHDCGLPSVRTTRTVCWCLPPSLSSAAANSRSTIMWLP
jgi:hypothetical protein